MENKKLFYDQKYSDLHLDKKLLERARQDLALVFELCNLTSLKKLKILDVGGGAGYQSLVFKEIGHTVTFTDFSKNACEHVRNFSIHHVVEGDIFSTNMEPQFDIIFLKGFSPLGTSSLTDFKTKINFFEDLLLPGGIILFWSRYSLTGKLGKGNFRCINDKQSKYFDASYFILKHNYIFCNKNVEKFLRPFSKLISEFFPLGLNFIGIRKK